MKYDLIVRHPFGEYTTGMRLTDPKVVAAVLESHPTSVVRVLAAAVPASTIP